jgi:hypothetical protein
MKVRVPRIVVVVAGFAVFMGVGLLAAYLRSLLPSAEEECKKVCLARGRQWALVPLYPKSMTGARDAPLKCECR